MRIQWRRFRGGIKREATMRRALVVAAALLVFAARVEAAPIMVVDQENSLVTGVVVNSTGFGQSFTPTLAAVDAFEVSIATTGSSSDIRLDLFVGAGFGGTLLGSSATLTITNTAFATVHFDLGATLTPAQIYTLRMTLTGGDTYTGQLSNGGNPYPGGTAFASSGLALPTIDLVFREGLSAIAEPATLPLLGAGLLGLGAARRRRRPV
jgi:hypothetical protein